MGRPKAKPAGTVADSRNGALQSCTGSCPRSPDLHTGDTQEHKHKSTSTPQTPACRVLPALQQRGPTIIASELAGGRGRPSNARSSDRSGAASAASRRCAARLHAPPCLYCYRFPKPQRLLRFAGALRLQSLSRASLGKNSTRSGWCARAHGRQTHMGCSAPQPRNAIMFIMLLAGSSAAHE